MSELIHNHPDHFLCVVMLISRIGDITTTYLATPTLKLEANPIMRLLRWPFAILGDVVLAQSPEKVPRPIRFQASSDACFSCFRPFGLS
jgi:hypothetical protein